MKAKFIICLLILSCIIFKTTEIAFGKQYTQGYWAVSYLYSSDGFWKPLKNIQHNFEKYAVGTANHAYSPVDFNNAAQMGQYLTCKDEEGHLLGDFDLDGEIDSYGRNGYAFHSHNGRNSLNVSTTTPLYTFFYDDNYLGRIIANIYGTDKPFGLGLYNDKIRYSIYAGKNAPAFLYKGETKFSTASDYAYTGVYYLDNVDYLNAKSVYTNLIEFLKPVYNPNISIMMYTYSNLSANVDIANTLIFVSVYYHTMKDKDALQHYISLRSTLLNNQSKSVTVYYPAEIVLTGWVNPEGILAFKETALAVIALGAGIHVNYQYMPDSASDKIYNKLFSDFAASSTLQRYMTQNVYRVIPITGSITGTNNITMKPNKGQRYPQGDLEVIWFMRCFDYYNSGNGYVSSFYIQYNTAPTPSSITLYTANSFFDTADSMKKICDEDRWSSYIYTATLSSPDNYKFCAFASAFSTPSTTLCCTNYIIVPQDQSHYSVRYKTMTNPVCASDQVFIFTHQVDGFWANSSTFFHAGVYEQYTCISDGYPSKLFDVTGTIKYNSCPTNTIQLGNRCVACPCDNINRNTSDPDFFGNAGAATYCGSTNSYLDTTLVLDANGLFFTKGYAKLGLYFYLQPCVLPTACGSISQKKLSVGTANQCVANCPSGYIYDAVLFTCTPCSAGQVAEINGSTCLSSCPIGKINYQNACISSCPSGLFVENGQCVNCQKNIILDPSIIMFKTPLDIFTTVQSNTGTCVSDICSYFNLTRKLGSKYCTTCGLVDSYKPYYDELSKSCVAENSCPDTTVKSVTNKACIKCSNIAQYKLLTHYSKIIVDFVYCYFCEHNNKYTDNFTCYDKCQGFNGSTDYLSCVNCKTLTPQQKNYYGKCVIDSGRPYIVTNVDFNVIVDCNDAGKLAYKDTCVDACPDGTATFINGFECFDWKKISQFMLNNHTVESCPSPLNSINYYYDDKNICLICNKILYNNECIDECPTGLVVIDKQCIYCATLNKINFNQNCVDSCPTGSYYDQSSGSCFFCKNQNQLLIEGDNKCSDTCPYGYYLDSFKGVCKKDISN